MIKWNKKVTIKDLQKAGACNTWKKIFNRCFPKGAVLNLKNLENFYEFCLGRNSYYDCTSENKSYNKICGIYDFHYALKYLATFMNAVDKAEIKFRYTKKMSPKKAENFFKNKNNFDGK